MLLSGAVAADPPVIRAGSELNFRPYCFTDQDGQPVGFGVDLLTAVADKMGLPLLITPAPWDEVWSRLVAGELDVLPIVARTPGREPLVDFSLPHTETFDAFFVREGRPPLEDLAAAAGKEIVVLRSDAAHHQLVERRFSGKVIPVGSIAEGLRLIAAGRHDAFLCSKMIGVLEREQAGIKGVQGGPVIPDYKRTFSFAIRKGNTELVEKLNQGLAIVKADGTYERIYQKWLGLEKPPVPKWQEYFWRAIGILGVLVLIAVTWFLARKALESDDGQPQALTPRPRGARAAFWRYALAVAAVLAGYALRVGLEAWVGPGLPTFVTFYPAVMVAALLGGLGPGLLATVAAALIANIWATPPVGELHVVSPVDRLALALFCVMGLLLTAVAELYRRNRAKAAAFDRDAAVRESEERFRLFMDNSPTIAWVKDEAGRFVYLSRAFEQRFGVRLADWRGKTDAELWPPDIAAEFRKNDLAVLAADRPLQVTEETRQPDGSRCYWLSTKFPFRDAAGRRYIAGIGLDITERKLSGEKLAASEALLRAVLDGTPDPIFLKDRESRLLLANTATFAVIGKPAEVCLGRSDEELYDNPADGRAIMANDRRIMASNKTETVEETVRTPSGPRHYLSTKAPYRDATGNIIGLIGVARDITERKAAEAALRQSEELLRAVTDNSPDAIYVKDRASRWLMANPAALRIVGRSSEQALGQTDLELYSDPAIGRAILENDRRIMESGRTEAFEEVADTPDGRRTFLSVKAPRRDAQANVIGLVAISRDITDRKQAEEELRRSNAELRFMDKHMVARELRMVEMKGEINDLCARLGIPPAYPGHSPKDLTRPEDETTFRAEQT